MTKKEKTSKRVKKVADYNLKNQALSHQHSPKGITLVALVVTIIVLLILSGVTILTLFGDNGLITMAQKAKSETENAQANTIAEVESLIDELNSILIDGETGEGGGNTGSGTETPPVEISVALDKPTITKEIESGSTATETLTATLNNATGTLNWTSSNESVATISGTENTVRTITLKSAGTATITVSYSGDATKKATCIITVTQTSDLISFTILDTKDHSTLNCTAYVGMTWGEWIESEFNEYGLVVNSNGYIYRGEPGFVPGPPSTRVSPEDVIATDSEYFIDIDSRNLQDSTKGFEVTEVGKQVNLN